MNKKALYESIMRNVAKEVKRVLNEGAPIDFKARLAARHAEDDDLPIVDLMDDEYDNRIENPDNSMFKAVDHYNNKVVGIIVHCAFKGIDDVNTIFMPMSEVYDYAYFGENDNSKEKDMWMEENADVVYDHLQDEYNSFAFKPVWNWVVPANARIPEEDNRIMHRRRRY